MQIPDALLSWHTPIGGENWWSVLELSKLDLSHNELEGTLPDAMFIPLSELSVRRNCIRCLE
jgi:hypothetical protein